MIITTEHVFFWSEWPSNWHIANFTYNGNKYNCVEQFMMAQKARVFSDYETLMKIMEEKHPKAHKALGRQIKNFDPAKWDIYKYKVVLIGNLMKYQQNPELKKLLLETESRIFVEASPYDLIWGAGMNEIDCCRTGNWPGQNLLGEVLWDVRMIVRNTNI